MRKRVTHFIINTVKRGPHYSVGWTLQLEVSTLLKQKISTAVVQKLTRAARKAASGGSLSNKLKESVCENLQFNAASSVGMSENASTCKCASQTHQYVSIRQHTSAYVSIHAHHIRIRTPFWRTSTIHKNLSTLTC
jgi:hypothetical protein